MQAPVLQSTARRWRAGAWRGDEGDLPRVRSGRGEVQQLVNDCFYTLAERLVPQIHTKSQPQPQRKGGVIVETCGDDETSTVVSA